MSKTERARQVVDAAEKASNQPWFERLARLGFVANGVVHLLIGVLAWSLAFGGTGRADQSSALTLLKTQLFGPLLLWTCLIGCAFMALWHLSLALFGGTRVDGLRDVSREDVRAAAKESKQDPTSAKDNRTVKALGSTITNLGVGVVYAALSVLFAEFIFGEGSDSAQTAKSTTETINSLPGGPLLLIIGGLIIIGVGGYFIFKGVMRRFEKDLSLPASGALRGVTKALGLIGYVAKGLTLAAVGLLVIVASVQHTPAQSTGFNGALTGIREQPFGVPALAFIGAGLIAYGIYLFFRARLADMEA